MKNLKPQKYYIGIAGGFHDGAIALVNDHGEIVFAEATERFTQNKRALTTVADNFFLVNKLVETYPFLDYEIAVNWRMFATLTKHVTAAVAIFLIRKYRYLNRFIGKNLYNIDDNLFATLADFHGSSQFAMLSTVGASFKNALYLKLKLPHKPNEYFDHHHCHAYHAYYTSPVSNATILVIDGNGDEHISYSIFKANDHTLKKVHKNSSKASLGDYYGEITKWCGFSDISGEQWKVMGLAPYGTLNHKLLKDLEKWITVDGINIKRNKDEQKIKKNVMRDAYGKISKADLAFTCQFFYEVILMQLITNIYKIYPSTNLILAGGCVLNSAANGKIHTQTPYENIYVPSAPADDGSAIGAALLNFKKHNPNKAIPFFQTNPYLGFELHNTEIKAFITYSGFKYELTDYENIYRTVAASLFEGKIVAWVQGKAEMGPRALGNRSILANPGDLQMKEKINSCVKFREEFRPFAPSILEEYGNDYFENFFPTPFMERVLTIKKEKQHLIPAVTHVDGTGRLQTVSKSTNEHFYNLISAFHEISGVPVLLNTSLNVMGKPIVNSMADIAGVFTSSGIDILVVNNYIIYK
ncbi:MAG: albXV [Bacteroidota bacterium]|jgi:carbamoyltransferase|nr:albXV [Bacteroidota bacterium]